MLFNQKERCSLAQELRNHGYDLKISAKGYTDEELFSNHVFFVFKPNTIL